MIGVAARRACEWILVVFKLNPIQANFVELASRKPSVMNII